MLAGAVRFHYGHPDVWDKLFTMTNGGVSKSTKSLHVSEDVFGGYNVMLRGRDITYVDYHSVGKGRDMGFETILSFEGKVGGLAVWYGLAAHPTGPLNIAASLLHHCGGVGSACHGQQSTLRTSWWCRFWWVLGDVPSSAVDSNG